MSKKMFLYRAPIIIPFDALEGDQLDLKLAVSRWRDMTVDRVERAAADNPYTDDEEDEYHEAAMNCSVAVCHWSFYKRLDAPIIRMELGISDDGNYFVLGMVVLGTMTVAASRAMAEQLFNAAKAAGFKVDIMECQVPRSAIRPGENWPEEPEDAYIFQDGKWQAVTPCDESREPDVPPADLGQANFN